MLALIARELKDHVVHVVLAGLVTTIAVLAAILTGAWGVAEVSPLIVAGVMPLLLVLFCGLGAAQMYTDRANRISALLSTAAVTRSRIFVARVLAGAVIILAALVPLLITTVTILYFDEWPLGLYWGVIVEVFTAVALTGLACYCVGLLMGWTANKVIPVLGILFGTVLLMLLVVIKGFGMAAIMLLLLFSFAALLRVWHHFTSISL